MYQAKLSLKSTCRSLTQNTRIALGEMFIDAVDRLCVCFTTDAMRGGKQEFFSRDEMGKSCSKLEVRIIKRCASGCKTRTSDKPRSAIPSRVGLAYTETDSTIQCLHTAQDRRDRPGEYGTKA